MCKTAKAMEEPLGVIDSETRCLFLMEGTAANPFRPLPGEFYRQPDVVRQAHSFLKLNQIVASHGLMYFRLERVLGWRLDAAEFDGAEHGGIKQPG